MNESTISGTTGAVIHYSEIGIKKKNRAFFVGMLKRNIERALEGFAPGTLRTVSSRLILQLDEVLDEAGEKELVGRISPIPGVAHFGFIEQVRDRDLKKLGALCAKIARRELENGSPKTFRIETKRSDKQFRLTSVEISRLMGGEVLDATDLEVDLHTPDLTIRVEIMHDRFLAFAARHEGLGGLPVGSSGRVVSLLSSGIDSPVSSFRMMRRGCRVFYVHFHSMPYTQRASLDITRELVDQLSPYQPASTLIFLPLADIQQRIVTLAPSPLRVILYRRYMLRLAERVAHRVRAKALITGDSVGQVASQTLENLAAIEEAVAMPVLRPLVGMGKDEIIREAQALGTYEISIQPYEDCCSFLMPPQPETRARLEDVLEAEAALGDMTELLEASLSNAERTRVTTRPVTGRVPT